MDFGQLVFAFMFAGVGAVTAWLGVMMFIQSRRLVAVGLRTTGKVIALKPESSEDGDGNTSTVFYPIVEFKDGRGRNVRAKGSVGSAPAAFKLQEIVPVVYDPSRPDDAEIGTFGQLWAFPTILITAGVILMTIGMAAAIFDF